MLNLKIALRFLSYKPIKTLIALLSILIGTAVFYFILNVGGSLKQFIYSLTAESNGHIQIIGNFDGSNNHISNITNDVYNLNKNITDISYSYTIKGTTNNWKDKNDTIQGPELLQGMDFTSAMNIYDFKERIKYFKGNQRLPNNDYGSLIDGEIIVSSNIYDTQLKNFGVDINNNIINFIYKDHPYKLKIVGIYDGQLFSKSNTTIFTTIETVQKITSLEIANQIIIRVKVPLSATKVANNITPYLEDTYTNFNIIDWQQGNRFIVDAIYIEDVTLFIMQLFTAISITFGLVIITAFNIKEKTNQIGILKTMGINTSNSMFIFLSYTIILSLVGITLGLLTGNALSNLFMVVFRRPNFDRPLIPLKPNLLNYYTLITLIVLAIGNILFSLIPINKVRQLQIIEIIKSN